MKDYRFVLENLYLCRGNKSGKNWLLYIEQLESNAPEEKFVEANTYKILLDLKKFLIGNLKKLVSFKTIRLLIEKFMIEYDEEYIGNIGNILFIIELLSNEDEYKDTLLMKELIRIFC